MQESAQAAGPPGEEEWVVWNGSAGVLLMASLGRIESGASGRQAWLARPFDMVGPFSLDELEREGRISFAACIVMSRQRWQTDQVELRRQAYEQRREAHERFNAEHGSFHDGFAGEGDLQARGTSEREHRDLLSLPREGRLDAHAIKAAFRRLAQKAHPDQGGSHEAFVRLTAARDALLARAA